MKESISYSFLLNIIILFIFVCAAIITGIFSYYRAFRAGTMIVNEIEKFEGFNCVSAESISQKLSGVSYNLPFDVNCKTGETNCVTDAGKNYKVYSYNLDASSSTPTSIEKIAIGDSSYDGASSISCDGNMCTMSSKYQYGVYTYMYIDLPIVSGLVRIPIFNKTRVMIDQRALSSVKSGDKTYVFDRDVLPYEYMKNYSKYYDDYAESQDEIGKEVDVSSSVNYVDAIKMFSQQKVFTNYVKKNLSGYEYYNDELEKYGYGIRLDDKYQERESNLRELFKASDANLENSQSLNDTLKKKCGTVVDWSLF